MSSPENVLFELLKKEIADTYRIAYPSCTIPIEEWKGQDIANFQEELIKKVKGRISEKWFYTHIKATGEKLPRIDMLNMLSQYADYQDWRDFTTKKQDFTSENTGLESENVPELDAPTLKNKIEREVAASQSSKKGIFWLWASVFIILIIIVLLLVKDKNKVYAGCFSSFQGQPLINKSGIEVYVLNGDESPVPVKCDKNGCFEYTTTRDQIRFVVLSPYYKRDTITRVLRTKRMEEHIKLHTDDYALMIHYFSTAKVNDWKSRRLQLEDMIAAGAKIYQVYGNGNGMELYNKEEFIDKLTMPLKSLKNIEIIETRYSGNQISLLRFMHLDQITQ